MTGANGTCSVFDGTLMRATYDSPLGGITMTADDRGLVGLWFDHQRYFADVLNRFNIHVETLAIAPNDGHHAIDASLAWLDEYFAGRIPDIRVPLHQIGTPFRLEVWRLLQEIPYGSTVTYGDLARKMEERRGDGHRVSARAVGGAVGHNPISIIVPCHRVVGVGGSLTGYAGGLATKTALLEIEGFDMRQQSLEVVLEIAER